MEKQFKHLSQDEYDKFISYLKEERSKEYEMLLSNEEWEDRFRGFLLGTKTLPLLYDPFFKIEKCRCVPVEEPELPILPICCDRVIVWPTDTFISLFI